jgi:soluble lytic murein transglycosylase-like protein
MPHDPAQLGARPLGQSGGERVFVRRGVQANLDQLVVAQGLVESPRDARGEARLADLHQGAERVGLRAQEAPLEAREAAPPFFAHAPHSTGARLASRLQLALVALLLWFGVACATTAPQPAAFAPMPRAMSLPEASPPVALPREAIAATQAAPLLDPAPPESASLIYARSVLGQRGDRLDDVQREGVARALVLAEADHGLSVLMTLAMITQESRFDPNAKGPTGSLGLMQLQPTTARDVARRHGLAWQSERTLLDPVQNVRIGLAYLAELRERFGSTDHAFAAYNIGPANLLKLLAKRPLRHGPYLKRVHAHADALQEEFGPPETAIGG